MARQGEEGGWLVDALVVGDRKRMHDVLQVGIDMDMVASCMLD